MITSKKINVYAPFRVAEWKHETKTFSPALKGEVSHNGSMKWMFALPLGLENGNIKPKPFHQT